MLKFSTASSVWPTQFSSSCRRRHLSRYIIVCWGSCTGKIRLTNCSTFPPDLSLKNANAFPTDTALDLAAIAPTPPPLNVVPPPATRYPYTPSPPSRARATLGVSHAMVSHLPQIDVPSIARSAVRVCISWGIFWRRPARTIALRVRDHIPAHLCTASKDIAFVM